MNVSVSMMRSCSHENTKGITIKRQGLMMAEVPKINYAVWIFHRNSVERVFLSSLSFSLSCKSHCTQHMCESVRYQQWVRSRQESGLLWPLSLSLHAAPSPLLSLPWNEYSRGINLSLRFRLGGQKEMGTIARNRGKFGYMLFRFLFHTIHQTVRNNTQQKLYYGWSVPAADATAGAATVVVVVVCNRSIFRLRMYCFFFSFRNCHAMDAYRIDADNIHTPLLSTMYTTSHRLLFKSILAAVDAASASDLFMRL